MKCLAQRYLHKLWLSLLRSVVMALLSLGLCHAQEASVASINTDPKHVVIEKYYQQALYAYFQGDFAQALLYLALLEQTTSQALTLVPTYLRNEALEPILLKGAISLAYGLEDQAAAIFQQSLQQYSDPEKRTFSWFLLGQTYYQQGRFKQAQEAFLAITADDALVYLDQTSRDTLLYSQAQLAAYFGTEEPGAWLSKLSADSIYLPYLQYNQALVLLQQGKSQEAINQLRQLAEPQQSSFGAFVDGWLSPLWQADELSDSDTSLSQDEERRGLQDRANLSLGYVLLQQNQAPEAYRVFAKVRRAGLDGDAALLGYGWAAAKNDELQTALGIWQALMQLPYDSSFSLEAYLASAYAYEQAFAPKQAVQVLDQGVKRFNSALQQIQLAQQQVQDPAFIIALANRIDVQRNDVQPPGSAKKGFTEDPAQPATSILSRVVNAVVLSNHFRQKLDALKQSLRIQQQLEEWQQRLVSYHVMLDERQAAREAEAKNMLQDRIFDRLPTLQAKRDELKQQLEDSGSQSSNVSLMSSEFQAWQQRLADAKLTWQRIQNRRQALNQAPLDAAYQQRLARIEGVLSWQASEAYPAKYWQTQRLLNDVDDALREASGQQQALLTVINQRPDYSAQRNRVEVLQQGIAQQQTTTTSIQNTLLAELTKALHSALQDQQAAIEDYRIQAQLAMVRLQDQALQQNQHSTLPAVPAADIGRPPMLESGQNDVSRQDQR
jgi:tetratricopeptide (TPR) repeat protein